MGTYFCYQDEHLSTNMWTYIQIPHKYLYKEFTGIQEENSGLSTRLKKNATVKKYLFNVSYYARFTWHNSIMNHYRTLIASIYHIQIHSSNYISI